MYIGKHNIFLGPFGFFHFLYPPSPFRTLGFRVVVDFACTPILIPYENL
jgi:hypothetical protein